MCATLLQKSTGRRWSTQTAVTLPSTCLTNEYSVWSRGGEAVSVDSSLKLFDKKFSYKSSLIIRPASGLLFIVLIIKRRCVKMAGPRDGGVTQSNLKMRVSSLTSRGLKSPINWSWQTTHHLNIWHLLIRLPESKETIFVLEDSARRPKSTTTPRVQIVTKTRNWVRKYPIGT